MRIVAACPEARAGGVHPGLPLADARARLPALVARPADPAGDIEGLNRLARWCVRYTPWTSPDAEHNGVWLDITGCAHLLAKKDQSGEDALAGDLLSRLRGAGYDARVGIADTPGAAWAASRYLAKRDAAILPEGGQAAALAAVPVAGLRLDDSLRADLDRLGLRTIGDLTRLPRASLARRFGPLPGLRLDQLSGAVAEPVSPLRPVPELRSRLAFAEPIGLRDDIDAGLRQLLEDLEARLEAQALGVRRLELAFFRADGTTQALAIGTSRPVRDGKALERLFRDKLDTVEPGFGIDLMMLNVLASARLRPRQLSGHAGGGEPDTGPLIDRLANRLGAANVNRLVAVESHIPEKACRETPLLSGKEASERAHWDGPVGISGRQCAPDAVAKRRAPRPLRLLPNPQPIDVMAPVPDHPPMTFRWRRRTHRVARADGPERIGPEWWLEAAMSGRPEARETRDYYALEDDAGARFWVYREGPYRPDRAPRWFLHGFFS